MDVSETQIFWILVVKFVEYVGLRCRCSPPSSGWSPSSSSCCSCRSPPVRGWWRCSSGQQLPPSRSQVRWRMLSPRLVSFCWLGDPKMSFIIICYLLIENYVSYSYAEVLYFLIWFRFRKDIRISKKTLRCQWNRGVKIF